MTPPPAPDRPPFAIKLIDDRSTILRHLVEAIAIVAAGAWAFYTFVYQERIKPASQPAALSLSIEVRRLGRDATREILSVTERFGNAGKSEIDIAADAYNVWGVRYAKRVTTQGRALPNDRRFFRGLAVTSHELVATMAELRDASFGGKRDSHIIIEPGGEDSQSEVFAIRRGAYDAIHAVAIAVPVKTDGARVRVALARNRDGSAWLRVSPGADTYEDDTPTDFALVP